MQSVLAYESKATGVRRIASHCPPSSPFRPSGQRQGHGTASENSVQRLLEACASRRRGARPGVSQVQWTRDPTHRYLDARKRLLNGGCEQELRLASGWRQPQPREPSHASAAVGKEQEVCLRRSSARDSQGDAVEFGRLLSIVCSAVALHQVTRDGSGEPSLAIPAAHADSALCGTGVGVKNEQGRPHRPGHAAAA